jgi:hypothetical protein
LENAEDYASNRWTFENTPAHDNMQHCYVACTSTHSLDGAPRRGRLRLDAACAAAWAAAVAARPQAPAVCSDDVRLAAAHVAGVIAAASRMFTPSRARRGRTSVRYSRGFTPARSQLARIEYAIAARSPPVCEPANRSTHSLDGAPRRGRLRLDAACAAAWAAAVGGAPSGAGGLLG